MPESRRQVRYGGAAAWVRLQAIPHNAAQHVGTGFADHQVQSAANRIRHPLRENLHQRHTK